MSLLRQLYKKDTQVIEIIKTRPAPAASLTAQQ